MNEFRNGTRGTVSVLLAVLNGLGVLASAFGMLYQRPRFVEVYADLGVALPVVTRMLIAIPSSVVLFVALLLLALLIAKEFISNKTVPLVINVVWLLVGIAFAVLGAMALMAPLAATVEQM